MKYLSISLCLIITILSVIYINSIQDKMYEMYKISSSYACVSREKGGSDSYIDLKFGFEEYIKEYNNKKDDLMGELFVLYDIKLEKVVNLLSLKLKDYQYIAGNKIYYFYSPYVKYESINGSNVEIAVKDNIIKVGVPIIFSEI